MNYTYVHCMNFTRDEKNFKKSTVHNNNWDSFYLSRNLYVGFNKIIKLHFVTLLHVKRDRMSDENTHDTAPQYDFEFNHVRSVDVNYCFVFFFFNIIKYWTGVENLIS